MLHEAKSPASEGRHKAQIAGFARESRAKIPGSVRTPTQARIRYSRGRVPPPQKTLKYEARHLFRRDLPALPEFSLMSRYSLFQITSLSPERTWADTWHLWTVMMPRRSITGRLLWGKVWRRHDGRRWIYKKLVEYEPDDLV
jgi:hypothetical protein